VATPGGAARECVTIDDGGRRCGGRAPVLRPRRGRAQAHREPRAGAPRHHSARRTAHAARAGAAAGAGEGGERLPHRSGEPAAGARTQLQGPARATREHDRWRGMGGRRDVPGGPAAGFQGRDAARAGPRGAQGRHEPRGGRGHAGGAGGDGQGGRRRGSVDEAAIEAAGVAVDLVVYAAGKPRARREGLRRRWRDD